MKLHKGQNTHVLSLPLGMEGTGVRESKSAGQNNTMYHESCHYQIIIIVLHEGGRETISVLITWRMWPVNF